MWHFYSKSNTFIFEKVGLFVIAQSQETLRSGNIGYWVKFEEYYKDYGGQSINLKQFWEAVDARKSFEEAAFETFTGQWAKKNGFTKAVIRNVKEDISNKKVVIKFLKE